MSGHDQSILDMHFTLEHKLVTVDSDGALKTSMTSAAVAEYEDETDEARRAVIREKFGVGKTMNQKKVNKLQVIKTAPIARASMLYPQPQAEYAGLQGSSIEYGADTPENSPAARRQPNRRANPPRYDANVE